MLLMERESSSMPSNAMLRWDWRSEREKVSLSSKSGPSEAWTCSLAHVITSESPWRSFKICQHKNIYSKRLVTKNWYVCCIGSSKCKIFIKICLASLVLEMYPCPNRHLVCQFLCFSYSVFHLHKTSISMISRKLKKKFTFYFWFWPSKSQHSFVSGIISSLRGTERRADVGWPTSTNQIR